VLRLLVTANVVPNSPILVTLMMEAIHSYETSVLGRSARRTIPDDGILRDIQTLQMRRDGNGADGKKIK
jgi:hypothetical protein